MRSLLKFSIIAIFCCLFLMQTVTLAQDVKESIDKDTVIDFPEIDGWQKGRIITFSKSELGYGINYDSKTGGRVTVYVYDGGNKVISDNLNNKLLKKEIQNAKKEIKSYADKGIYQNVYEIYDDTIKLGGTLGNVEANRSILNFLVNDKFVTSEIYLFVYKNNFIKIRATRPLEEGGKKNETFVKLLAEIDKLFSK